MFGHITPALSAVRVFLLNTGNNGVFMYEMSTDRFFQYLVRIEQFQICSIEMEMVAFKSFHAKKDKFHQIKILRWQTFFWRNFLTEWSPVTNY